MRRWYTRSRADDVRPAPGSSDRPDRRVDSAVRRAPDSPAARFYDMMAYHHGWVAADGTPLDPPARTGKRARPILAILTCEAFGGTTEAARGPASALELIHNFSLVHDDIQDVSDQRHNRDTVWKLWGAAQGINVGDALYALAQVALAEQAAGHPRIGEGLLRLNRTCVRLVEGQYLDLSLESAADATFEQYEQMVARKTAALIECAAALGAWAAGASDPADRSGRPVRLRAWDRVSAPGRSARRLGRSDGDRQAGPRRRPEPQEGAADDAGAPAFRRLGPRGDARGAAGSAPAERGRRRPGGDVDGADRGAPAGRRDGPGAVRAGGAGDRTRRYRPARTRRSASCAPACASASPDPCRVLALAPLLRARSRAGPAARW